VTEPTFVPVSNICSVRLPGAVGVKRKSLVSPIVNCDVAVRAYWRRGSRSMPSLAIGVQVPSAAPCSDTTMSVLTVVMLMRRKRCGTPACSAIGSGVSEPLTYTRSPSG
jgi:hypothetical protein